MTQVAGGCYAFLGSLPETPAALDLAQYGITVNAYAPGPIGTTFRESRLLRQDISR